MHVRNESLGMAGGNPPAPSFAPTDFPGVWGAASWALLWEEQLIAQQSRFNSKEMCPISAPGVLSLDLWETGGICGEMGLVWDESGSFLPSLKAPPARCGTLSVHPGLEWDQRGQ